MQSEDLSNKTPKHKYQGKKNSNIVNFPILLRREVFSPVQYNELLNAPIVVARIIFKILNDISSDQFQQKKQPQQYQLFEKTFLTEDNTTASFDYSITELDKHRDYKNIEKGLTFLENLDRRWHKTKDSKGEPLKYFGGFITSPVFTKGRVGFRITAYWIQKMLSLGVYNPMYFETAFKLGDMKQWLFYLWLVEIKSSSTRITLENFNSTYGYNYKTAAAACKETLRPTYAAAFDKCANVSFTCKAKGNLIYIFPNHPVKTTKIKLTKETKSKQAITQKLAYWKRRHVLEKSHVATFRSFINKDLSTFNLFREAYKLLIEDCRKKEIKITSLKKDAFFIAFQPHIKVAYEKSAFAEMLPNGYPKLIEDA